MLSACVLRSPEKYVGAFTCIVTLSGLFVNIVTLAIFMQRVAFGSRGSCLAIAVAWGVAFLGLISCTGFIVAGIVSEGVNGSVHEFFTRIGFFGYAAYGIAATCALWRCPCSSTARKRSVRCKVTILLAGVVDIGIYIMLIANHEDGDPFVGLCEWTALVIIILFNLTYALDFQDGRQNLEVSFMG